MAKTLRSQVQSLSVLPLVVLTGLTILVSVVLTHRQVDAEAARNLQEITRLLTATTTERTDALSVQTKFLSGAKTLKYALDAHDRTAMAERATYFVKNTSASALLIADQNGNLLSNVGDLQNSHLDPQLKALIHGAIHGKADTEIVAQDGKIYTVAVQPLVGDEGTKAAIVALSPIDTGLANELHKITGADVVFLSKGRIVGSSLPLTVLGHSSDKMPWHLKFGGRAYVALATSLPKADPRLDCSLVALRPYEDLAAPFRAFSICFGGLLLVALTAVTLLARAFSRGLGARMEELVRTAQTVRDGGWPEKIEVCQDDELGLLQSVFNDMTEALHKSQDKILSLVDTDPLTDLENHRKFREHLDQEVFRACMSNKPLVLCLVDFDKFSDYNAQQGHTAGDEALKTMAALLNEVAPDIAFLARYGGEEFAMLLPLTTLDGAESILERLKSLSQGKFRAELTFSAGVAELTGGITTGAGLQLSSEMALSRAKQLGRNRICRFEAVPGASSQDDPFQLQRYLQDTTLATIQALAGAVDAKDSYTQGHSVRVARYAADLARYMGYPADYIYLVYKTGTLHDVGKIGVPDSILSKPSRLDPEEQAIMETHTVLGELIVKKAPQLEEMLPGVRHHHERWDGRGYPDKLMGINIPLLGRLIAIADTFDAMTSDRPYRRALPDDVALDEIKQKAGEQFDPELAESFVRMMRLNSRINRAA